MTLFRHEDLLGSLRFQTNSSQSVTGSGLFEAFGAPVGATGTTMPFGFVGGADCQTDADTGLVLMGHRYYDSRIGRFTSQDPAGDGNNWYAYAGNDPVNNTDPSGLSIIYDPSKMGSQWNSGWSDASGDYRDGDYGSFDTYRQDKNGVYQYAYTEVVGPTYSDFFLGGGMGTNMGHQPVFAAGSLTLPNNPSGLPEGWKPDPSHQSPDDTRWRGPNGEGLDHHEPQPGKGGWKEKNHWHKLRQKPNGGWETDPRVGRKGHLVPGDVVSWAVIGYGLWEVGKWGVAALAAPETGGLSLGAAALAP